jgi:hypothetical protein
MKIGLRVTGSIPVKAILQSITTFQFLKTFRLPIAPNMAIKVLKRKL